MGLYFYLCRYFYSLFCEGAKSIMVSQQECCNGKHYSIPIETFVINRCIINVFIVDEYQKVCLKQIDPLIQLSTESMNITCIGANESLQCNYEKASNEESSNDHVMSMSFNLLSKCEIFVRIEPLDNVTLKYIQTKQMNQLKECCVCQTYGNIFAISSNSYCEVKMSAVVSQQLIGINNNSVSLINQRTNASGLANHISPNIKLFQMSPLPYQSKENTTLQPYPSFDIIIQHQDISLKKFKWKASIGLMYKDLYPGILLGTTSIMISDINLDKIMFNNLIITKWGYDYVLKVMLKSIPEHYLIEKTLGPFNVWPINETQFNRVMQYSDSRPVTITIAFHNSDQLKIIESVDLVKMDLFLINYFGRIYTIVKWKNFFTEIVSDKLIGNAMISGSIESLLLTKSKLRSVINSTFNFDNQSFIVVDTDVDFESVPVKSPQEQPEYQQSKVSDSEADSLPVAWIAAIVINAILVFLFILFVIYCYCRGKKRRQRIHNPERDSVFSSKQSIQEVTKTELLEKKDAAKGVNESVKGKLSRNEDIFTVESEHKRLTEDTYGCEAESPGLSPANETSGKMSLKSPANKVRSISRLSSGARGSIHNASANDGHRYNPADSPSASMFSNQLKDSVPGQPTYLSKYEEEAQNAESDYRAMEPLAEVDESNKVFQEENFSDHNPGLNGNSGYTERDYQLEIIKQNELQLDLENSSLTEKRITSSRGMPSISTASNVINRVKSRGNSPNKVISPNKTAKHGVTPPSSQSTGVQTSPNTSWLNIPGAVDQDDYYDETNYSLKGDNERKYFVYIIKDVNPHAIKECVGRITLPSRQRITLEQLRHYLMQSSEESLRNAARKKFRFLSESYRLVALNESFTPVDQVYPTQGIFIKFNAIDSVPFSQRRRDKSRTTDKSVTDTYNQRENVYGTRNRLQAADSIYGTRNLNQKRESIYGPLRSTEKPRLGYDRSPRKREGLGVDRTPRKRDGLDTSTTPQQSTTSPMVSPRTKMRLCHKMQLQSQIEKGLLEERPSFTITSLDSVCDNTGCLNKPLLKCLKCGKVNYCSLTCKKQHWADHRFRCKKPPWKL